MGGLAVLLSMDVRRQDMMAAFRAPRFSIYRVMAGFLLSQELSQRARGKSIIR